MRIASAEIPMARWSAATHEAREAYRRKKVSERNAEKARARARERMQDQYSVAKARDSRGARAQMSAFARLEAKLRKKRGMPEPDAGSKPEQSAKKKVALLKEPREPLPEECCGNDCRLCVWTVYWQDLQAWEEQNRAKAA